MGKIRRRMVELERNDEAKENNREIKRKELAKNLKKKGGGTKMGNENPECQKCPYNIFKSQGGYGKLCDGNTMAKKKRCPEWRINEMRKENEEAAEEKTQAII